MNRLDSYMEYIRLWQRWKHGPFRRVTTLKFPELTTWKMATDVLRLHMEIVHGTHLGAGCRTCSGLEARVRELEESDGR